MDKTIRNKDFLPLLPIEIDPERTDTEEWKI